ncbi:MAG TPA: L-threonylcarbamoyladenylate synthase [Thermoanaerobaculia bacterium]|nr:L-threonylcarbamoyladenylate synthase [Thermoanaerobaculia bacterium]
MSVPAAARVARWGFGDDPEVVRAALDHGAVVAFPTESSYGLGVDPTDDRAVEALFRLKDRGAGKALPVVAADLAALGRLGVDLAARPMVWASLRWPAALTVVAPLARPIAASGGRTELAVRIPDHGPLRALLAALGRPLTATSANPAGAEPYLDPDAVAAWLERSGCEALVVGREPAPGGPPSTLVAFEGDAPRVLRQGRVAIA